jgi:hypothetical protein
MKPSAMQMWKSDRQLFYLMALWQAVGIPEACPECGRSHTNTDERKWNASNPLAGLSSQELEQFQQLRKVLGNETVLVIFWVLENWGEFSQQAKAEAGLSLAPEKPLVGFLLIHYATAVKMIETLDPEEIVTTVDTFIEKSERYETWIQKSMAMS